MSSKLARFTDWVVSLAQTVGYNFVEIFGTPGCRYSSGDYSRQYELPDFTTVCTRKQDLKMRIWRVLLRLSAELHDTGDVQAIDATGMNRIAASQHYAKRTNYTFKAVKTTTLIDCKTGAILDIHCSMKQPHDSKIGWQMIKRNLDKLNILTADKGYDWWPLAKDCVQKA